MGLINDDEEFVDEVFRFAHCILDFRILDFMFAHLNLQSLESYWQQPTRPFRNASLASLWRGFYCRPLYPKKTDGIFIKGVGVPDIPWE